MATPTYKGRQDSKVGAATVQEREENEDWTDNICNIVIQDDELGHL